jgi:hypothetical protein
VDEASKVEGPVIPEQAVLVLKANQLAGARRRRRPVEGGGKGSA